MSARWRVFWILCWVVAAAGTWPRAQSSVTLQPSTSPTSGQPGIHNITVTGSSYPAGTIPPANVTVSFAPATTGAGPSGSAPALAVQTIFGSTRRVTFRIPSSILVAAPTAYRVSVAGATSAGIAFASGNSAALTVNPPPSLTSVDPATANPGEALPVALTATFTNFVQGATQASFGPGISVGGAAAGGFGPVTVTGATSATAQIAIDTSAAPGPRTVAVRTGVQQAARDAGFTVVQPNRPPVAHAGGPYAAQAGEPIVFGAGGSTDPDGDPLTFAWSFGDGDEGTGAAPSHAYAAAGTFTASVTASDGRGGSDTATATVTIAPASLAIAVTEPAEGQTIAASPIVVRGAVNDATARIVVQDAAAVLAAGTFEARRIALVEGANDLVVRARNDRGETASLVRRVTLDTIPPAITITSTPDHAVRTDAVLPVAGLVSDATTTTCTLGGAPLAVNAGAFSGEATLLPGRNELAIACVDAAGNLAGRTLTTFFDTALLAVTGTTPADRALDVPPETTVAVTFSEPVDPQSVTDTTVFLASGSTVLSATLTVAEDRRSVTLVPASPLPQGSRIDLTVTTGVSDALGIPPPYPFFATFFTSGAAPAAGTVVGEVFDDTRGLPLEGALVEALDAGGGVLASATADARGRYLLVAGGAGLRLRISHPGFTIVERTGAASSGPLTEILDARLTPLAPEQSIDNLLGGTAASASGDALQLLPGSLGGEAGVRLTPVSEQGPRVPLPAGWRPLGIVDVAGPAGFAPPAALTIADRSRTGAGAAAVFARYDEASARWIAVQEAVVDGAGTARLDAVNGPGQFALVAADAGTGAPPGAVVGDPLQEGEAPAPIPDSAVASGAVTPPVGRSDDPTPAAAQVTIGAQDPLRSGTMLRGDFVELFLLRDGGRVTPLGTSQDFVAYRVPADPDGRTLAARFPIAPSQTFDPADLSEGTITVALSRASVAGRTLIGAAGGGVVAPDGSRLLVPAGAFPRDVPVALRRITAEDFSTPLPAGIAFAGGLAVDLAGAVSAAPLTLTLGRAASLARTGSQLVVAELRTVRGRERLVFVSTARIDGDGLTSVAVHDAVSLPGVRAGGRYAFFRFDGPLAIVSGTARDAAERLDSHVVELDTSPFIAVTDTAGRFVLAPPVAPFVLVATAATTHDRATHEGQPGTPIPEIVIGATPPRVERVTVRLPRAEGNFAGPLVLLGKPGPAIDDDGIGASAGDGDGVIEPGERIELRLTVRNDGTVAMIGGSLALRVRGPAGTVAVEPLSLSVDDLPPDEAREAGPFVYEAPASGDPSLLRYELVYANGGGISRVIPFELPLGVDHLDVPTGSEITVLFSEPVLPSTLAAGIALEREVGASVEPVAARVLAGEDASVVTIRPEAPLAQDALYRLTLAASIVDEDSRPLAEAPVVERFSTEDRTPPAAIAQGLLELAIPDAEGFALVSGSAGSVNPDDVVIALNETTGFSVLAAVDAQGGFTARLRADVWDQVTILVRDRHGNETRVPPGPFVRRNAATGAIDATVIGRQGGTVTGADGLRLVVPAGALPGATEMQVSRVAEAFALPSDLAANPAVAAAFASRFTVIDRVRIEADLARFVASVRLVLTAPPGMGSADRFVVVRGRQVAIGGALADLDAATGVPLAQNPRRVAERLEIVESASVKTVDGQLVLSTDSPPFDGITEPGLLTVLRVNEPLTFLTGEVRRDASTGPVVANAVVQTLPGDEAMAPFAAATNARGVFVVADGSIDGGLAAGATVSSRLDTSDPLFQRVIRRGVRAVVQSTAPPNTVVARLVEPFVLPAVLPPAFTAILGDLEPPEVDVAIAGPSLVEGFTRLGDPLTVTVTARDNDIVTFVGLELDSGSGFEAVPLTGAGTFSTTPEAPALLTFRAHARDRQGNETFVDRRVRAAASDGGGGFAVGALPGPPVLIEPESRPASVDGDVAVPVSEPLAPTTVNEETVQLLDPEGLPVEIDVSLEGNGTVIRVDPRRLLRLGACYTLVLSDLILDLSGEPLGGTTFTVTIPPPTHVTTIQLPNTNDVAIDGDLMVAVNTPDAAGVFGAGAIHAFRIHGPAGLPLNDPVRLTPQDGFATNGRPLSVALERDRAYVGNRFLGAIATQQPLVVSFVPTAFTPDVDTILGCGVELSLTVICTGLTSIWQNLPQPASNLQVLDLADPAQPRHASGRALNFIPPDTWNPNTWPDRVEITDQGVAVLNFSENVEVFTRTPRSLGTIGHIRRYGEITSGLGFLDVSYFRGGMGVVLEESGLRIVSTSAVQDPLARETMTTLGFVSIAGAHGGRVGTVSGYHWIDGQGLPHVTDLAFVASRTLGLQVYAVNGPTLVPPASPSSPRLLDTMPGVFGTMSFDACRGVAYVYGFNGRFHVVDFTDPTALRELNDPGSGLAFQLSDLGSRLTFNGIASSNGRVFLAGDAGVAIVDTGGCTRLGGTCGQAGGPAAGPVQLAQCPVSPSALLNPNCAAERCFGDELQTSIDSRPPGAPVVLAAGGVSTLRLTLDGSASGPVHVFLTATGQGDVTFGQRDVLLAPGGTQTVSISAAVASGSIGDTAIQLHMGAEDGPVCDSIPLTVVALDVQLDSNNDTMVDASDDADEEDSAFVFWTNPQAGDAAINGKNDLENLALLRLRVSTPSLLPLPAGYRYELQLEALDGFASINLFRRLGGDFDRFTPSIVAEQQGREARLLQLTTAGGQDLPFGEFAGDTATLLLEGVTPGRARMRLALIGPGGQELFADEALIELEPVRQLYSVAYARELPVGSDPVLFWPYRGQGFAEQLDPAKTSTIVFVHGFNVTEDSAFATFDGAYRRFYWSKLTGPGGTADLVGFTWTGDEGLAPQYNVNVFNAFQASVRFRELIGQLRAARPSGAINVMAHSLGNGVVSNAIQLAGLDGQSLGIGTYLLHQAAIGVNAYGPTSVGLHPDLVRQARDWGYPNDVPLVHLGLVQWDPPRWQQYPASDPWGGYFGLVRGQTRLVNTFSLADCVLGRPPFAASTWWVNQQGSRPDCTIQFPDGPAGSPLPLPVGIPGCTSLPLRTWTTLPEGPAPSQPPDRERQWAELAFYYNDLTEPAAVAWMPGATNIDGEPLGISGSCLADPIGGVHSAFMQKPLGEVWRFWNCASTQLGGRGAAGSCAP